MKMARLALALAAPLLLASCLLTPGKFVSSLDIRKDRSFNFSYAGEVIMLDPQQQMESSMETPSASGDGEEGEGDDTESEAAPAPAAPPAAPPVETAEKRAERQAVAEALSKEVGYRSVEYLGNNRFRVDYSMSGRLDRGFVYPINLDAMAIAPWIAVEVRKDGTARVKALAFGDPDTAFPGDMGGNKDKPQREGTFTLTTDASLVMQNNEEGMAPGPGTKVVWKVTPTSKTVPTAVVRF
jgi:hypothetical protein